VHHAVVPGVPEVLEAAGLLGWHAVGVISWETGLIMA
jgi:hypothetical protein